MPDEFAELRELVQGSQMTRWVKRVGFVMSAVRPVYPKQQTFPGPIGTSHLCQKPTLEMRVTPQADNFKANRHFAFVP
jgi:hypothetical protein